MHALFSLLIAHRAWLSVRGCSIMCFHHKTTPYPHSCGHKGELARSAALRSEAEHYVFHTRADTEVDLPEIRALELVKCPTSWSFSYCFHMLRTGALGLAPSYWEATWFFSFCHREYTLDIDSYGSVCNSFHDCFCQMSWKAILVYIVLCMFASLEWNGTPSKPCTGADGHQVWKKEKRRGSSLPQGPLHRDVSRLILCQRR